MSLLHLRLGRQLARILRCLSLRTAVESESGLLGQTAILNEVLPDELARLMRRRKVAMFYFAAFYEEARARTGLGRLANAIKEPAPSQLFQVFNFLGDSTDVDRDSSLHVLLLLYVEERRGPHVGFVAGFLARLQLFGPLKMGERGLVLQRSFPVFVKLLRLASYVRLVDVLQLR